MEKRKSMLPEWLKKYLVDKRIGDCLALLLPPLALSMALLLPLPWDFQDTIFYLFVGLLAVLLGYGPFKKWHSHPWYFLWLGAAVFFAFLYVSGRSDPMPNFFGDVFSYVEYSFNCHGPCYVPLSLAGSAGIVVFFGLLIFLAKRAFPRLFFHAVFAALSFWAFYLIIISPLYVLLAEFNLGVTPISLPVTASRTISLSLVLLAIFLAAAAGCLGRKRFLPFVSLFALLFLSTNAATLQYMKHHVGYSIRWMDGYQGNMDNLLALFRNYTDMLWVRPAFYAGILLLGILLFIFFIKTGNRIAGWQRKLKDSGRGGSWAIHALSLPKLISWLTGPLVLFYIVSELMLNRLNLNRIDRALCGNHLGIDKAKENLRSFLFFVALIVIAGAVSLLRGRCWRPSSGPALFSLAWLRGRALEIACILVIVFVLAITCTGFKVGAKDWQNSEMRKKEAQRSNEIL